jgi:tetratricopeptide (TPR) repeat protein
MLQLRLTQHPAADGRHRVEISLEGDGARRTAEAVFPFQLTPQDEEELRWYLEDHLQYPQDPAPKIARRIEERLAELGTELFRAVFPSGEDAGDLWVEVRNKLPSTRVEIVTGVAEATSIPWELLRDPKNEEPVALSAAAFVRAQPSSSRAVQMGEKRGKVRILLVICRPRGTQGEEDAPFRSVASRLIKGLDEANREAYDLDVLRPPTFEQLGRALRQAKDEGRPYHVVHFDGHGTYREVEAGGLAGVLRSLSTVVLGARSGQHGYLLFENPKLEENAELVDGPSLGKLLFENQVPVLVLNACRSAHAEPAAQPGTAADPHSQVRAFGSLAQEVMDAGAAGVVAMRYNVYVVTAAQLAAELYASLAHGHSLGEAVTRARKNLAEDPLREVAFEPLSLQDWPVPVVYEAAPLRLFPEVQGGDGLHIRISAGASAMAGGSLDPALPPPPDAGFYGRDETLLALDRAFDQDRIVLLHAYAGSGKTATAAEFARWYALTGGVDGPVLFTSFERYLPLPRVLDRIGQVFGPGLEQAGIHWLALDDAARREMALQVLAQVPVLWIWDNVEPVTGFPAGTESAWSAKEQEELAAFLRAARGTKAKLLLTSRRDESAWLGNLPTRVPVKPMPLTESLQLARALAAKHGRRLSEVEDWRPLLAFAGGNPLAVTVLVGQALRDGLTTKEKIEGFVARLRSGEVAFSDEREEGRTRSLGASLAYGFEHAFSEEDRRKIALLHLFQGFVEVTALRVMGDPEAPWCLPEVRGLTREEGIALLDRAAEAGLLTAHGGGYSSIHPALPWFFRSLFEQCYPEGGLAAVRAYVEAMGELGNYYHDEYGAGNRGVIAPLRAEEANLLHARRLARAHGWWDRVISAMQGLRTLYDHTGRRAEWKRLVEEIVPDYVDLASEGPIPGREEEWGLVMEYRVRLARQERQWAEADRLLELRVTRDRQRAAPSLVRPVKELEAAEWNAIRTLVASLHELGEIRRELGRADCVPVYEEALELAQRIGERAGAATCAFNLGHAFEEIASLRDLGKVESWYQKSLALSSEGDRQGRGKCFGELGNVARERFKEARAAGAPDAELLEHLNEAARLYHEALDLLPPDAVADLAVIHNQLGSTYGDAGDLDRALPHFRQAIQYDEIQGNLHGAAQTRFNVAIGLLNADRRADALEYAEAALRGFESYGERAAEDIEDTRGLIAEIRG